VIVCCGEALVDLVPEAVPGGGPLNVAVAAARQGAPTAFLGRLSRDRYGELIRRHLSASGVDLTLVEWGDEPTARAIVEHAPRLRFRFEGDASADTALGRADLSALGAERHAVHGGTLGLFRGRTAEVLARLVDRYDGLISLDPNVRPSLIDDRARWDHFHDRWRRRTHLYRASDEDLDWIWPARSVDSVAAELLAAGVRAVVVTRGAQGATAFTATGETTVAGRPVTVHDTVGAGDTFVATMLVSLLEAGVAASPDAAAPAGTSGVADRLDRLEAGTWRTIVERAVAASALCCTRRGADPPNRSELDAALGLREGPEPR